MAAVAQAVAAQEGDAAVASAHPEVAASVAAPASDQEAASAAASAEAATAAASTRGGVLFDSRGIPAHDSWEDEEEADWGEPPLSPEGMVLPTGADVVAALDSDAEEVADEEDQETTIADAMADAKEAVAKEEGAASGAASTRVADDEPEEAPTRKKMRSAEAEAGPAEAAPAAASTRGPARRQAMKSRIIVQKEGSSEKYSLVCAATQMEAEINRVLESRAAAILDEARESFGASTPEEARLRLVQARRACVVKGSRGRHNYLVIDGQLQKRSRFYIFLVAPGHPGRSAGYSGSRCRGQGAMPSLCHAAGPAGYIHTRAPARNVTDCRGDGVITGISSANEPCARCARTWEACLRATA